MNGGFDRASRSGWDAAQDAVDAEQDRDPQDAPVEATYQAWRRMQGQAGFMVLRNYRDWLAATGDGRVPQRWQTSGRRRRRA
jgi:hypothetical protein